MCVCVCVSPPSLLHITYQVMNLFPLVKSIILNPTYLLSGAVADHWHVRQMSAAGLAEILHQCGSPFNEYVPDVYASFRQMLAQPDVPLQVLYGIVLSLCHMGGEVSLLLYLCYMYMYVHYMATHVHVHVFIAHVHVHVYTCTLFTP